MAKEKAGTATLGVIISWAVFVALSPAYIAYAWAMSALPAKSSAFLPSGEAIYLTSRPIYACIGVGCAALFMLWASITKRIGWVVYLALSIVILLTGQAIVRHQNKLPILASPSAVRDIIQSTER